MITRDQAVAAHGDYRLPPSWQGQPLHDVQIVLDESGLVVGVNVDGRSMQVPLDSRPAIELQPRGLPIVVVPLLVESISFVTAAEPSATRSPGHPRGAA